jgi:hypothetical protein
VRRASQKGLSPQLISSLRAAEAVFVSVAAGIEGTSFRAKIPLGERDWQRLESLATTLSAEGFSPSAGQVGSVLLSLALRSITEESPASEREQASYTEALAKKLAARLAAEKSR